MAVHEFAHSAYEHGLLSLSPSYAEYQLRPRWMAEGMAVFYTAMALSHSGVTRYSHERLYSLEKQAEIYRSLAEIEAWPEWSERDAISCIYRCGFLAMELLAAHVGMKQLTSYYAEKPAGSTWQQSFQHAFEITVEEFYDLFEAHRAAGFSRYEIPANIPNSGPTLDPVYSEGLIQLARTLPWFVSPPDVSHALAKTATLELWMVDPDLGRRIAELAWVIDGIDETERTVVSRLAYIAANDPPLAKQLADSAWVIDGLQRNDHVVLEDLYQLIRADLEMAQTVFGLGGQSFARNFGLDPAHQTTRYPWLLDGLSVHEIGAMVALSRIAIEDPELGRQLIQLEWAVGEVNESGRWFVRILAKVARDDLPLLRRMLACVWLDDGMSPQEMRGLESMGRIFWRDPTLTDRISRLSWVEDGIITQESGVLRQLAQFVFQNPESPLLDTIKEDLGLVELRELILVGRSAEGRTKN